MARKIPLEPDSETRIAVPPQEPPTDEALIAAYRKLAQGKWRGILVRTSKVDEGVTLGDVGRVQRSAYLMSAAATELPYEDVIGIVFLILMHLREDTAVGERYAIAHSVVQADAGAHKAAAESRGAAEILADELRTGISRVLKMMGPHLGWAPKTAPGQEMPNGDGPTEGQPSWLYTRPKYAAKFVGETAPGIVGLIDVAALSGNSPPARDGMLLFEAEFASLLESFGGAGKLAAGAIRKNAPDRLEAYHLDENARALWSRWLVEDAGNLGPEHVLSLAKVLWRDIVAPRIEKEIAQSKARSIVRAPTDLVAAVAHGRQAGGIIQGTIHSAFVPAMPLIHVQPPKGIALMLPFKEGVQVQRKEGLVSLRNVLTAAASRTHFATFILWQDGGMRQDGSFDCEGPSAILDCLGTRRVANRGHDTRFHSKAMAAVKEHLAMIQRTTVCQVGEIAVSPGSPLLQHITHEPTGRTIGYAHAQIITGALLGSYVRVPRLAGQLEAEDFPFALGMAAVIRAQAMHMLLEKKTKVEAPITAWLDAAGENWKAEAAKRGSTYWTKMRERLVTVAGEATLGTMQLFGAGRDTVVELDVNDELRESYKPLLESRKRHQNAEQRALIESKKTRRLPR